MNTEGGPASSPDSSKPPVSCLSCSRRKVKCDKQHPCMNCKRRHSECIYSTTRKKRVRGPGKTRVGERLEHMTDRVTSLEGLITRLQSQVHVKESPNTGKSKRLDQVEEPSGSQVNSEADDTVPRSKPRLVVQGDKTLYIGSTFWANMNSRYVDKDEPTPPDSNPTPSSNLSIETDSIASGSSNLLFGASSGSISHEILRPASVLIPTYWHFYVSNFDPLYKILHKPYVETIIEAACEDKKTISPSHEALLFAIYLGVVTSLSAEQVKNHLFDDRVCLLNRFRCGLESSLARAGLLNTSELTTLQALVIYIICIRRFGDPRTTWTLVGLASRIALGMGLHHDGTKFNISPWMTEMRRRVWWQVYLLEMRAAEDQGCEMIITSDLFDAKFPLNINDEDFDINATELPPNRSAITEMSMGLVRLHMVELGLAIGAIDRGVSARWAKKLTFQERLDAIKDTERKVHHQYLQHCQQSDAMSILTYTLAKLNVAKLTLTVYHSNEDSQAAAKTGMSRDELFGMSISVIENAEILESLPIFRPWLWACQKYMHWYAVAYILMELCSPSRRGSHLYERGWRAIDSLNVLTDQILAPDQTQEAISRPIRKLLEQARQLRADAQMTQLQYESRLQEFEQWNIKQFQGLGPKSENFVWFHNTDDHSQMASVGGSIPMTQPPIQPLIVPEFEFQDNMDMADLFQVEPHEVYGTVFGGGVNGWMVT